MLILREIIFCIGICGIFSRWAIKSALFLIIAHANDFIEYEDMASAAAGLLFVNGIGAISGPLIIGYAMNAFGPEIFFVIIFLLMRLWLHMRVIE